MPTFVSCICIHAYLCTISYFKLDKDSKDYGSAVENHGNIIITGVPIQRTYVTTTSR